MSPRELDALCLKLLSDAERPERREKLEALCAKFKSAIRPWAIGKDGEKLLVGDLVAWNGADCSEFWVIERFCMDRGKKFAVVWFDYRAGYQLMPPEELMRC